MVPRIGLATAAAPPRRATSAAISRPGLVRHARSSDRPLPSHLVGCKPDDQPDERAADHSAAVGYCGRPRRRRPAHAGRNDPAACTITRRRSSAGRDSARHCRTCGSLIKRLEAGAAATIAQSAGGSLSDLRSRPPPQSHLADRAAVVHDSRLYYLARPASDRLRHRCSSLAGTVDEPIRPHPRGRERHHYFVHLSVSESLSRDGSRLRHQGLGRRSPRDRRHASDFDSNSIRGCIGGIGLQQQAPADCGWWRGHPRRAAVRVHRSDHLGQRQPRAAPDDRIQCDADRQCLHPHLQRQSAAALRRLLHAVGFSGDSQSRQPGEQIRFLSHSAVSLSYRFSREPRHRPRRSQVAIRICHRLVRLSDAGVAWHRDAARHAVVHFRHCHGAVDAGQLGHSSFSQGASFHCE